MSRKRYTKRQDIFVLPDTVWCKYPSLDTVWYNTDMKTQSPLGAFTQGYGSLKRRSPRHASLKMLGIYLHYSCAFRLT